MADTKISALTAATTPLAGTEVLPIVQSGVTKQVSVADLTAGRAVSAASLSLTTTPLATTSGGTGLSSYTAGDLPYYATGTTLSKLGIGASTTILTSSGTAPQWSAASSVTIGTATNIAGGAAGSVPYQTGAGATSFLAIGTAYYMLGVNAGATAPSWQPSATSVLTTQGDLLYASAANTLARLAKNTTASRYLSNGGTSNNPAWAQIDLSNGVTGVLPVANGGTNASSASITAFNNITGYTASGATGTTSTNLVFSTSPSITTATLVGDNTLSTGNLIQGTAAKGINFTANTGAAGKTSQLLNWYEEGTWTPALSASTPGNFTPTYTTQEATYTRVGRNVTVTGRIYLTSFTNTTGSGDLFITGLPFTPSGYYFPGSLEFAGVTKVGYTQFTPFATPSQTYLRIDCSSSATAVTTLQVTDLTAGGRPYFVFQVTYQV